MPTNEASITATATTISEAQHRANQLNAQKSTGPRTPEGKARAKMNALRHGLTGQFCVMSEADRLAFTAYEKRLLEALAPVGEYERDLALSITQNRWRLHRARALENNVFGLLQQDLAEDFDADTPETEVAVAHAQAWLGHHPALTNLTLYENRIRRDIARDKKELDDLQAKRLTAEAKAREEAELLLQQSLTNKEPITPNAAIEVNGFVFSNSTLLAGLHRKAALKTARAAQSPTKTTPKSPNRSPKPTQKPPEAP